MLGWTGDIEALTLENTTFRTVLYTGAHAQLTVMSVEPGGDVGWERHANLDQFLRVEQGTARLELGSTEDAVEERHEIGPDWAMVIPAGAWHNLVNTGTDALKLYSLYSPPAHAPGTVHVTRADDQEHDHDQVGGSPTASTPTPA
jgi:mannose-6-phosphate isomerase-like protein (cupin superfamily)